MIWLFVGMVYFAWSFLMLCNRWELAVEDMREHRFTAWQRVFYVVFLILTGPIWRVLGLIGGLL